MRIFLETKRLIIQTPSEKDFKDQYKLQSDPDVMKYFANGARDANGVKRVLNMMIQHYEKHGFSLGSVFEKETGNFVGRAGLMYLACDDTQPDIEIGYALLKQCWNKGYATELAKALIQWGFAHININKLVAVTHPENKKSKHILEKVGMHYVKQSYCLGIEVAFYEITKMDDP